MTDKIDWTKPIETVPCGRNAKAVPCEFHGFDEYGDVEIFIRGDWFSDIGMNQNDYADLCNPWIYLKDKFGIATTPGMLPNIRNVPQ